MQQLMLSRAAAQIGKTAALNTSIGAVNSSGSSLCHARRHVSTYDGDGGSMLDSSNSDGLADVSTERRRLVMRLQCLLRDELQHFRREGNRRGEMPARSPLPPSMRQGHSKEGRQTADPTTTGAARNVHGRLDPLEQLLLKKREMANARDIPDQEAGAGPSPSSSSATAPSPSDGSTAAVEMLLSTPIPLWTAEALTLALSTLQLHVEASPIDGSFAMRLAQVWESVGGGILRKIAHAQRRRVRGSVAGAASPTEECWSQSVFAAILELALACVAKAALTAQYALTAPHRHSAATLLGAMVPEVMYLMDTCLHLRPLGTLRGHLSSASQGGDNGFYAVQPYPPSPLEPDTVLLGVHLCRALVDVATKQKQTSTAAGHVGGKREATTAFSSLGISQKALQLYRSYRHVLDAHDVEQCMRYVEHATLMMNNKNATAAPPHSGAAVQLPPPPPASLRQQVLVMVLELLAKNSGTAAHGDVVALYEWERSMEEAANVHCKTMAAVNERRHGDNAAGNATALFGPDGIPLLKKSARKGPGQGGSANGPPIPTVASLSLAAFTLPPSVVKLISLSAYHCGRWDISAAMAMDALVASGEASQAHRRRGSSACNALSTHTGPSASSSSASFEQCVALASAAILTASHAPCSSSGKGRPATSTFESDQSIVSIFTQMARAEQEMMGVHDDGGSGFRSDDITIPIGSTPLRPSIFTTSLSDEALGAVAAASVRLGLTDLTMHVWRHCCLRWERPMMVTPHLQNSVAMPTTAGDAVSPSHATITNGRYDPYSSVHPLSVAIPSPVAVASLKAADVELMESLLEEHYYHNESHGGGSSGDADDSLRLSSEGSAAPCARGPTAANTVLAHLLSPHQVRFGGHDALIYGRLQRLAVACLEFQKRGSGEKALSVAKLGDSARAEARVEKSERKALFDEVMRCAASTTRHDTLTRSLIAMSLVALGKASEAVDWLRTMVTTSSAALSWFGAVGCASDSSEGATNHIQPIVAFSVGQSLIEAVATSSSSSSSSFRSTVLLASLVVSNVSRSPLDKQTVEEFNILLERQMMLPTAPPGTNDGVLASLVAVGATDGMSHIAALATALRPSADAGATAGRGTASAAALWRQYRTVAAALAGGGDDGSVLGGCADLLMLEALTENETLRWASDVEEALVPLVIAVARCALNARSDPPSPTIAPPLASSSVSVLSRFLAECDKAEDSCVVSVAEMLEHDTNAGSASASASTALLMRNVMLSLLRLGRFDWCLRLSTAAAADACGGAAAAGGADFYSEALALVSGRSSSSVVVVMPTASSDAAQLTAFCSFVATAVRLSHSAVLSSEGMLLEHSVASARCLSLGWDAVAKMKMSMSAPSTTSTPTEAVADENQCHHHIAQMCSATAAVLESGTAAVVATAGRRSAQMELARSLWTAALQNVLWLIEGSLGAVSAASHPQNPKGSSSSALFSSSSISDVSACLEAIAESIYVLMQNAHVLETFAPSIISSHQLRSLLETALKQWCALFYTVQTAEDGTTCPPLLPQGESGLVSRLMWLQQQSVAVPPTTVSSRSCPLPPPSTHSAAAAFSDPLVTGLIWGYLQSEKAKRVATMAQQEDEERLYQSKGSRSARDAGVLNKATRGRRLISDFAAMGSPLGYGVLPNSTNSNGSLAAGGASDPAGVERLRQVMAVLEPLHSATHLHDGGDSMLLDEWSHQDQLTSDVFSSSSSSSGRGAKGRRPLKLGGAAMALMAPASKPATAASTAMATAAPADVAAVAAFVDRIMSASSSSAIGSGSADSVPSAAADAERRDHQSFAVARSLHEALLVAFVSRDVAAARARIGQLVAEVDGALARAREDGEKNATSRCDWLSNASLTRLFEASCYATGTVSELARFERLRAMYLAHRRSFTLPSLPTPIAADGSAAHLSLLPAAVAGNHPSPSVDSALLLLMSSAVTALQRYDAASGRLAVLYAYHRHDGSSSGLRNAATARIVGELLSLRGDAAAPSSSSLACWREWGRYLRTVVRSSLTTSPSSSSSVANVSDPISSAIRLQVLYSNRRSEWAMLNQKGNSGNGNSGVASGPSHNGTNEGDPSTSSGTATTTSFTWVDTADLYRGVETLFLDAVTLLYGSAAAKTSPRAVSRHFVMGSKPMTGAQFTASFLLALERAMVMRGGPSPSQAAADGGGGSSSPSSGGAPRTEAMGQQFGRISHELLSLWRMLEASDVLYFTHPSGGGAAGGGDSTSQQPNTGAGSSSLPTESAAWRAACFVGAELLWAHVLELLPTIADYRREDPNTSTSVGAYRDTLGDLPNPKALESPAATVAASPPIAAPAVVVTIDPILLRPMLDWDREVIKTASSSSSTRYVNSVSRMSSMSPTAHGSTIGGRGLSAVDELNALIERLDRNDDDGDGECATNALSSSSSPPPAQSSAVLRYFTDCTVANNSQAPTDGEDGPLHFANTVNTRPLALLTQSTLPPTLLEALIKHAPSDEDALRIFFSVAYRDTATTSPPPRLGPNTAGHDDEKEGAAPQSSVETNVADEEMYNSWFEKKDSSSSTAGLAMGPLTISRSVLTSAALPLLQRLRSFGGGGSSSSSSRFTPTATLHLLGKQRAQHEVAVAIFRACRQAPPNSLMKHIAMVGEERREAIVRAEEEAREKAARRRGSKRTAAASSSRKGASEGPSAVVAVSSAAASMIHSTPLPMKLLVEVLRHLTASPRHTLAFYTQFIQPTYALSEGVLPLLSLMRAGRAALEERQQQSGDDRTASSEHCEVVGESLVLLAMAEYLRLGTSLEEVALPTPRAASEHTTAARRNHHGQRNADALGRMDRLRSKEKGTADAASHRSASGGVAAPQTLVSDRLSANAKAEFTRAMSSIHRARILRGCPLSTTTAAETDTARKAKGVSAFCGDDDALDASPLVVKERRGDVAESPTAHDRFAVLVGEMRSNGLVDTHFGKALP